MKEKFFQRALSVTALVTAALTSLAQPSQPLSWKIEAAPATDGVYEITATGRFTSPDWHIYDLQEYADGPNPTVVAIEGDGISVIEAPAITSGIKREFDPTFGQVIGTCTGPVIVKAVIKSTTAASATIHIEWQCCNEGSCLPPDEFETDVKLAETAGGPEKAPTYGSRGSLWPIILEAMAWGFVALLTPCVFPMIPMTVSFFLKRNTSEEEGKKKKRRGSWLALFFGLSIVGLYTIPIAALIVISLLTGGESVTADIFNFLATHWIPNLLFFLIFMAFAASFFGAFEIVLPSGLVNKSDAKSEKGGLLGAFFVALTLVLVSFSCTGPIVGSVLIKSTQGQFWEPVITMLAFSISFALPFTILAFTPSLMKKLPKSGGWLGSVKVVLGFIEIALGFKFLSVADQTYHWELLGRETYLAIWIVVFSMLGFYLLGKLKFEGDSDIKHISVTRLGLAIAVFSFVVYMIPGMWGAPLKALSGYLPPITTQDFVLGENSDAQVRHVSSSEGRKYADKLELPYGIPAYFDYNQARSAAITSGKPLFVDFTGHGCVNCREMEARVWSDSRALEMLINDYVVCALFADDKMIVNEEDWVKTADGKTLKSLGKINSHFALERFNVNAQPYYAILDPVTEEQLVPSRGYDLDVEAFVKFLSDGLTDYSSSTIRRPSYASGPSGL